MDKIIQLKGRIFLNFDIETRSGLHIGGSDEGISIGGVDKTVIRDPLTNRPYIPGSSLRGKMRSLTEKYRGAVQNQDIGPQVTIHSCKEEAEYKNCPICHIYGVPGERDFATPTRLIMRDVRLSDGSADRLNDLRTDLPYTEVKTEVAIDRVTSAANPRQMERVPAGAIFSDAELVYSVYGGNGFDSQADLDNFKIVITGLQLLEDDYLGGLGSRGSGKVSLRNIRVRVKAGKDYAEVKPIGKQTYATLADLAADLEGLTDSIGAAFQD